MQKYLNGWTDLDAGEEELRAISQALDEVGVKVHLHYDDSVWVLDVTFDRIWGEGGTVPAVLNLRMEESAEHARDRMGDEADLADAYAIADRLRQE